VVISSAPKCGSVRPESGEMEFVTGKWVVRRTSAALRSFLSAENRWFSNQFLTDAHDLSRGSSGASRSEKRAATGAAALFRSNRWAVGWLTCSCPPAGHGRTGT
jgi:hypothetical protein